MRSRRLPVDGFPGWIELMMSSSPDEVRGAARSVKVPTGWFSSRSYRNHYGLVATSPSRVGADIEIVDPSVTPDAVLTRQESQRFGALDLCSWWSAKEALAKALGDARNYDPRRLETPALWRLGHQGRWRAEKLDVPTGHVGWVVWEVHRTSCRPTGIS